MTASIYDFYDSDQDRELNGVWVDIGPSKFKIARSGGANTPFKKYVAKKFKPYQSAIANGTMPPELADKLSREAFVETCLHGWESVTDRGGKAVEFSKEAAHKLLEELPNLFAELLKASDDLSRFQRQNQEDAAKN